MNEAAEKSVIEDRSGESDVRNRQSDPAATGRRIDHVPARNPYPGLRPFLVDEEHFFFGRESQTDVMVDKLAANRFLTVIGSSGSGKSSLVNCGLRVALRAGLMSSAGTSWRMVQLRPGGDPVGALARALSEKDVLFRDFEAAGMPLEEIVETNLRMSRVGLVDVVEQARLGESVNTLIVVDQFEELFRYRHRDDDGDAVAFVNLLLEARRQAALHRIYIVLTMRSDFLGDCARYPGLAEAINEGQYLVPQMTREERRLAIEGPVTVCGARMAPVLLTRLVNDLGDDPDQLSVLQHALNRIWAAWAATESEGEGDADSSLNLKHYSAIGSMANALDRHAEKAFAELKTERQQSLARRMFQALTDKSTDVRGVRRPTALRTLCAITGASSAELVEIIDVFRKPSRSFLMPPAEEPLVPETVIDVSHESLMRKWQRLIRWADEEARSVQTYRRLAETASLYAANKAGLWRDPDLHIALDWKTRAQPTEAWAARYGAGFLAAMQFLAASATARDAEKAAQEATSQRELELDRARELAGEQAIRIDAQERAARDHRRTMQVTTGALVVSTVLALYAFSQNRSKNVAQTVASVAIEKVEQISEDKENVVAALVKDRSELASESVMSGILRNAVTIHANEKLGYEDQVQTLSNSLGDIEIKQRATWKLIAKGDLARDTEGARATFDNTTEHAVLVLLLSDAGEETLPTAIAAGVSVTIELFVNDIWVARSTAAGQVIAADVVDGDVTISLDDQ